MRLIVVCAAALAGLAGGDLRPLEPKGLVAGGLLALVGAALAWRRPGLRVLALAAFAVAVGGLRAALVPAEDTAALEPYVGQVVRLGGLVVQPPSVGATTEQLLLDAQRVGPPGRDPPRAATAPSPVPVRVVGEPAALEAVAQGDALVLEGRLVSGANRGPPTLLFPRLLERTPPEQPEPSTLLARLRQQAQAGIHAYLPEPQASLSAGVLLGGTGGLGADFRLQLQRSGLAHVVAIDGAKQVVVAAVLGALAARLLGFTLAALPIVLGIAAYTVLTGAHPAAVRAGLMIGLAVLAARTGRLADSLTSVLLAATIMAAVEPRVLLDVGFQLSTSATLGIVLLWPRLRPGLKGLPRVVAEPVGLTLAVTLATLPVALSVFQLVSLVSPLAHVLAVPLLPLVLISAAMLALVSPIAPLAAAVAWLAWLPSTLLVAVVQLFGSLPGAALSTGRLPPLAAYGLAATLLVWGTWRLPEAAGLRRRVRRAAARGTVGATLWVPTVCVCACVAAALLLRIVRPDGQLHVHRLALARGEAVFIRGPTGRTALVVGGRLDAVQLESGVADELAVWEHQLDSVLQLDPSARAGLGLTMARYPSEHVVDAALGTRVDLGGGAVLDVVPAQGQSAPGAAISFGRVSVPLDGAAAPGRADLSSDGFEVWSSGDA